MACLIAYHGWGFDRSCWTEWQTHFQQKDHQFVCFDRGYFGQPQNPEFWSDRPYILLLHSFGLHLCPATTVATADVVMIFNSFLDFHPDQPGLRRRSRLTLQRMGDRFQTHPQEVLQAFWQNCAIPEQRQPQTLVQVNYPLLQQDLGHLNTVHLTKRSPTVQALQQIQTLWVIHSDADKIVPLSQGATLADAVGSCHWVCIPDTGHALPFSHPERCWTLPPFTTL